MNFSIKKATGFSIKTLLLLPLLKGANGIGCPYFQAKSHNALRLSSQQHIVPVSNRRLKDGDGGIPDGGYDAVKQYIIDNVLTNSKDYFPADFDPPNYGGLMIRLAWHCSGGYRATDGRGGCDGARIRFSPESGWMDNANLDYARKLLEPVKEKFGKKLSWGDLIILAGNAAIESMGGPVLGFCGGRIDDNDGTDSLLLGPSNQQEELSPCRSIGKDGECNRVTESPIGPTTIELIYVDPNGVKGAVGDTVRSQEDIEFTFARMGMDDYETVSLIGGGHAFGKCHVNTSGFEGAWSSTPTKWSNEYFANILDLDWTLGPVPNGTNDDLRQWTTANNSDIIALTSDLALREGKYAHISKIYKDNLTKLEEDFQYAWYKLTTADMGPVSRCIGNNIPPAQAFQNPLPEASSEVIKPSAQALHTPLHEDSSNNIDFVSIRAKIQELLDGDAKNRAAFVNLAYQCASTYRSTDYKGGCNGARIRFSPEKDWEANKATAESLKVLNAVKEGFPSISMADLIVLAGQTAVEDAGLDKMKFCGGRVDATDGSGSEVLAPRHYPSAVVTVKDDIAVKGLTLAEGVALSARFSLSNQFYKDLLDGKDTFTQLQKALIEDAELKALVEKFASDEDEFKTVFAQAWTKMMIADRFDGPRDNLCSDRDDVTLTPSDKVSQPGETSGAYMTSTVLGFVVGIVPIIFF